MEGVDEKKSQCRRRKMADGGFRQVGGSSRCNLITFFFLSPFGSCQPGFENRMSSGEVPTPSEFALTNKDPILTRERGSLYSSACEESKFLTEKVIKSRP